MPISSLALGELSSSSEMLLDDESESDESLYKDGGDTAVAWGDPSVVGDDPSAVFEDDPWITFEDDTAVALDDRSVAFECDPSVVLDDTAVAPVKPSLSAESPLGSLIDRESEGSISVYSLLS